MKIAACILLFSASALAGLGQSADSVERDRKDFGAVRQDAVEHANYRVEEINKPGLTVREYVTTTNIVFAIAWSGIAQPDLTNLLGNYFTEFSSNTGQTRPGHAKRGGGSVVRGEHVVVERSGHMRAMRGRAYVTAMFPANFTVADIE